MTTLVALAVLAPAGYVHEISHGGTRLTVRNQQTGRVIWWRRVEGDLHVSWTPDRRAMVALGYDVTVLSWRAGERVQRIPFIPSIAQGGEPPGLEGSPAISPDGRFAAVFMGASMGAADLEMFNVLIIDLREKTTLRLKDPDSPGSDLLVQSLKWTGSRKLRLNEVIFGGTEDNPTVDYSQRDWLRRGSKWTRANS
jgi:hypothetical protein